jgi:uncharacterized protein YeeX (DUF496 family)
MERELEQLQKKADRLQAELDREIAYTRKVNDKNMELLEQIKTLKRQLENSIPKADHERIVAAIRHEYEESLSEIKIQGTHIHNERGAGRKRIATQEIVARAMELRGQGLAQGKIAVILSEEYGIRIGRTTVGDIVRGEYTPSNTE